MGDLPYHMNINGDEELLFVVGINRSPSEGRRCVTATSFDCCKMTIHITKEG